MIPGNGYPRRDHRRLYPAMIWHDFMTAALAKVFRWDFRPPPRCCSAGRG